MKATHIPPKHQAFQTHKMNSVLSKPQTHVVTYPLSFAVTLK